MQLFGFSFDMGSCTLKTVSEPTENAEVFNDGSPNANFTTDSRK